MVSERNAVLWRRRPRQCNGKNAVMEGDSVGVVRDFGCVGARNSTKAMHGRQGRQLFWDTPGTIMYIFVALWINLGSST
jgi:hypothetical protein